MKKTPKTIKAKFDAQNLEAARIIAADPVRYPGGMQDWATLVLKRLERPGGRQVSNDE
jgi:hypothetical protein